MSELPTPGNILSRKRIDGRLGLAAGIVAAAAVVMGGLLYALHDGSTKSASRPSGGTSGRSEPAPFPVAPPPSKHETKETAPTTPPHGR
jgi:hypothetical protein